MISKAVMIVKVRMKEDEGDSKNPDGNDRKCDCKGNKKGQTKVCWGEDKRQSEDE